MLWLSHQHLWKRTQSPALVWLSLLVLAGYVFTVHPNVTRKMSCESSVPVQRDSVVHILNKWRLLLSWLRLLGSELCLEHKRLPSRSSPRTLRAAKVKKLRLVLVSAGLPRAALSPDELNFSHENIFFLCRSQQSRIRSRLSVPVRASPQPSIADQQQLRTFGQEWTKTGWCTSPRTFLVSFCPDWWVLFSLVIFPLLLCDRAADQHTYLPNRRGGATSTLASKRCAAWFPLWRPNQMWVRPSAGLCETGGHCCGDVCASHYLSFDFQITNAVTLQKTVEHIGKLQQERQQLQEEVRRLREEIEVLNSSIK